MYLGDRKIAGATKNIISRISCELEFEKQSGRTFLHMSNVSGVSAASIERIHKNPKKRIVGHMGQIGSTVW